MERTYISEMVPEEECRISGFVDAIRQMRWGAFVVLRDMSGKVQVTFGKDEFPEIVNVTTHSVLTVVGTLHLNPSVKMGGKEVAPKSLVIESLAEALPIADDSDIDARMDYRWIDLRREQNHLMMKLQTTLTAAMPRGLFASAEQRTAAKHGDKQRTYRNNRNFSAKLMRRFQFVFKHKIHLINQVV